MNKLKVTDDEKLRKHRCRLFEETELGVKDDTKMAQEVLVLINIASLNGTDDG